jgi:leucyl aminopeptidase
VNEPANVLGVDSLVARAKEMASASGLEINVIEDPAKEGLGLLAGVGQGASVAPRLVRLSYAPKGAKGRVAVVGKGIVFDSGGLCLKPAEGMLEMKTDMAGAGVVLSAMCALHRLDVRKRVDAYIPIAENAIGANAVRPGDVLASHRGLIVEVTNTDAEGRLILADALSLARLDAPDVIVDFATLTGACSIALGRKRAAVYCDDESLAADWLEAAAAAGEKVWRMPLARELQSELKSDVADLRNSGGRFGGSISAALFLQRFVSTRKWVHFDIAGPARNSAATVLCPKGGTGFGVLTLLEYLRKR